MLPMTVYLKARNGFLQSQPAGAEVKVPCQLEKWIDVLVWHDLCFIAI